MPQRGSDPSEPRRFSARCTYPDLVRGSWLNQADPLPVTETSGDIAAFVASVGVVLFKQFFDNDLGCASYLVGDEQAGAAVVVDPAYAIEQYLDECKRHDVELVAVLETHTHADHVSGHGTLALERGVPVHVHRLAGADFPHVPLED